MQDPFRPKRSPRHASAHTALGRAKGRVGQFRPLVVASAPCTKRGVGGQSPGRVAPGRPRMQNWRGCSDGTGFLAPPATWGHAGGERKMLGARLATACVRRLVRAYLSFRAAPPGAAGNGVPKRAGVSAWEAVTREGAILFQNVAADAAGSPRPRDASTQPCSGRWGRRRVPPAAPPGVLSRGARCRASWQRSGGRLGVSPPSRATRGDL